MKKLTKIMAIILSVLMIVSVVQITASAKTYSGKCGEGVSWSFNTKTGVLSITGTGVMADYSSDSPSPWDEYSDSIETVNIASGVKSIGSHAFEYCDCLEKVTIPNSVTTIGRYAFDECELLKSVIIPDSVTCIDYNAFSYCSSLKTVTIGNGVTSIGFDAFTDCTSLESITIPNSVTSIGSGAFCGCKLLTSVTLPNGITSIYNYLFEECTSLQSIYIPDSVTKIGIYAFSECTSLTRITIPNSVTSIGNGAFDECDNLTVHCYQGSYIDTYASENSIPVTYHTFGEWYVETPATATTNGQNRRDCAICSCYETEVIPAIETHIWVYDTASQHKCLNCEQTEDHTDENGDGKCDVCGGQLIKIGDGNRDGTVDAQDLITLIRALLTDSEYIEVLDVSGDGVLDTRDIVKMKRYLADNSVPLGKQNTPTPISQND